MDYFIKLVFLFFISTSVNAGVWDLNSRFNARNISAFKKYDVLLAKKDSLGRLLAGVAEVNYEASTVGGKKVFANRTVNITKKVAGGLFKRLSFTPWGASISLALVGAGYAIDSINNTVTVGSIASTELGYCGYFGANFTITDCIAVAVPAGLGSIYTVWRPNDSGYGIGANGNCCYSIWAPNSGQNLGLAPEGAVVPATDEQIYDAVEPQFSDSTLKDVFTDVGTGLPNSNVNPAPNPVDTSTPETDPFTSVADVITNNYNNQVTNNTTVDPTTVSNDYTNTSNVYTQSVSEKKTDCERDPTMVGCSHLGADLSSVSISNVSVPFSFTPVSLSSSSSCPTPKTYNYSHGSFTVPTQYLCDFAVGINSIVVIVCSLVGLTILVGGIRNA